MTTTMNQEQTNNNIKEITLNSMTGDKYIFNTEDTSIINIIKMFMIKSNKSYYHFEIFEEGKEEALTITDEDLTTSNKYYVMINDKIDEKKAFNIKWHYLSPIFERIRETDDLDIINMIDKREIGDFTYEDLTQDYEKCKIFYEAYDKGDNETIIEMVNTRNIIICYLEEENIYEYIEDDEDGEIFIKTNLTEEEQEEIYNLITDDDLDITEKVEEYYNQH